MEDHFCGFATIFAQMETNSQTEMESDASNFEVGQKVKVNVPLEVLRTVQDGHGGFTPKMCEAIPMLGEVIEISDKGDLRVKYPNNIFWTWNPKAMIAIQNESGSSCANVLRSESHNTVHRPSSPSGEPTECLVCSETTDICTLEPCGHKIACFDCTSILKKCLTCKVDICRRLTVDGFIVDYIPQSQRPTVERMRYLQMQIRTLEDINMCNICLENNRNKVFRCGHSCCANCSRNVTSCHVCRQPVTESFTLY